VSKPVIYKIRNVVNQKFYVGSTVNHRERFRNHRRLLRSGKHHCKHLQAAWNKYGEDCFKFEIVEVVESAEVLWEHEDFWLEEHFGQDYCYNAGRRADAPMRGRTGELNPNYGKTLTDEQKAVLRAARFLQPDPRLGKKHTEETKERIRQKHLASPQSFWLGKTRSEETKAKIGAAQKGKPKTPGRTVSEEGRAKIRAAAQAGHYSHWKGRTHTQEAREKMAKPIYVQKPDGSQETYPSLSYIRDNLGISVATTIRACKSGKPIQTGTASGWRMSYEPIEAVAVPVEYADLPRTRQLAKEQGAKYYFTGEPCEHGHIAPRIVKGTCTECRKVDWQKRNEANKGKPKSEASKAAGRRYYEKKKLAAAQANCHNALTGVSGVADGPGRRHADSSTPTCM